MMVFFTKSLRLIDFLWASSSAMQLLMPVIKQNNAMTFQILFDDF